MLVSRASWRFKMGTAAVLYVTTLPSVALTARAQVGSVGEPGSDTSAETLPATPEPAAPPTGPSEPAAQAPPRDQLAPDASSEQALIERVLGLWSVDSNDLHVLMIAVGAGFTSYLMPAHVYFTTAVGIASLSESARIEDVMLVAHTDVGFWVNADVGIEGWLSDDWSAGIAVRAMYASMPGGDGSQVEAPSLGLVVSLSGSHLGP